MKKILLSMIAMFVSLGMFAQTLADWTNENPGNVALSQETTTVQEGSTALGIICTTDAQAATEVVSASFTVTPGATFTASAYVWDNDIAGKARIAIDFSGSNEWGGYSNDGTDWELVEMTGTVPDGVTSATFFFRFYDISADWDGDFECILDNVVYSEDGGTTNLIQNASFETWEVLTPTVYTISEIQDTTGTGSDASVVEGEYVSTAGIVTAVYENDYTIQNGTGAWSGIWVAGTGVALGDDVTVIGTVSESNNLTKILAESVTVNTSGNALPTPETLTTLQVSAEEAYEGVLVTATGYCSTVDHGYGEWGFDDASGEARVDDYGLATAFVPVLGTEYQVTSPVLFSFGNFKFAVRTTADIVEQVGSDPYIAITAPEEGATVTSADVNIELNVQNFDVADGTGDGHIIYTLDAEAAVDHLTTDPIALTSLADGAHTVVVELVDNSGVSLDPAVSATVNFTVNTAGPTVTPIYDIQYTEAADGISPLVDQVVIVEGIVTAVNGDKFWMQDADAAWSGIYVFYTETPGPAIGDMVHVEGTVAEYYEATQIGDVTVMTVVSSGNTVYDAQVLTTAEAADEAYESVLVQIEGTSTADPDTYNQWPVNDGSGEILIDDVMYAHTPTVGNDYRVTGIATYSFSERKILPRDAADVVDLGVSTSPSISITNPANGSTIYTDAVDVVFTVANFVVGTDGKVAYSIDGSAAAYQTTIDDITFVGLSEGSHTVTLELVDMSEVSLDPAVTVSVTFDVSLAGPVITAIYDIQYATDGISPLEGQVVTVKGVVTANFNGTEYGSGYYVQDAAGAWNGLYIFDDANTPSIGDSVQVTGEISEYFEMTEMTDVSDYQVIAIGGEVPAPTIVTTAAAASEEQYESCLVKVQNAECTAEQNNYGEWTVNDGSGDVTCKDNGAFDFTEVLGTLYNVTGVINYAYGNYTLQYRVDTDIEVVDAIENVFSVETEVYPNPATTAVNLTNLDKVERVELISMVGQVLISENVSENTMKLNLESLASGVYMIKLTTGVESRVIRIEKN